MTARGILPIAYARIFEARRHQLEASFSTLQ